MRTISVSTCPHVQERGGMNRERVLQKRVPEQKFRERRRGGDAERGRRRERATFWKEEGVIIRSKMGSGARARKIREKFTKKIDTRMR